MHWHATAVQQQWRILLQLQHLRDLLVHVWLLDEEVGPSSLGQDGYGSVVRIEKTNKSNNEYYRLVSSSGSVIWKTIRQKCLQHQRCSRNLAEYYSADITLSKFGGLRLTPNFFRRIYGDGQKFGGYGEWRRPGGLDAPFSVWCRIQLVHCTQCAAHRRDRCA